MEGTIRTFDEQQRSDIHEHVKRITEMIAAAGGAQAKVQIERGYDVVVNDPALTEWSVPSLSRVGGEGNVGVMDKVCGAEDFSCYQKVGSGILLPPRLHSAGAGPAQGRAQPQPALLHGRALPEARREGAFHARRRLARRERRLRRTMGPLLHRGVPWPKNPSYPRKRASSPRGSTSTWSCAPPSVTDPP
jgi:hypothetical protein